MEFSIINTRKKDGSLIKLDKQYVILEWDLKDSDGTTEKRVNLWHGFIWDIIKKIEVISNKKYLSGDENIDIAIRVTLIILEP